MVKCFFEDKAMSDYIFRKVTLADIPNIYDWRMNKTVSRYMPLVDTSYETHCKWWERALSSPNEDHRISVWQGVEMFLTSLYYNNPHRHCEISGYAIPGSAIPGVSITKDAILCTFHYLFNHTPTNRIFTKVCTNNHKSVALHESIPVKNEGCLRQHFFINGSFRDVYIFSILRDEWNELGIRVMDYCLNS